MPRIGYVINGVYHRTDKVPLAEMNSVQQSTFKGWDHDRQRNEHAADIVQPFKGNRPNQEFIDLYPEASVDYGFIPKPENPSTNVNPYA